MCSPPIFPFPLLLPAFAGGQGLCHPTHCQFFVANNSAQGTVLPVTPGKWALSPLGPTPACQPQALVWLLLSVKSLAEGKLKEWLGLGRRALNSKSILYLYKDTSLIWLEM